MTDFTVPPPVPADDAIRRILAHRVDERRLSPGLVVGITEAGRHRIVAHGSVAVETGRPVGADTPFEIGSVTKLFTALLLADMAGRGEVAPDEPVVALLPSGPRIPERNGRPITLRDLVTHRSGLPHQPSNVEGVHWRDPENRYTAEHLHAFLDGHELARTPGDEPSYSNVGFALLGHALARRAGLPYGDLLRSRILAPLGMTATTVDAPPRPGEGAARGDDALDPVPDCIFGALAGAGALRSSAAEMLLFLDALRDPPASPLGGAVARLTAPPDDGGLGLGAPHPDAGPALSHLGRTTGFRSSAGCIPGWDRGVVVLANADNDVAADLAAHLLDARTGLSWFRAEVTVDPGVLEGLAGRYRLGPSEVFEVTPSGGRLRVRLTGQPAFRVFAASERHYFYRCVGAQLTFEPGEDGRAARLVLHQNGRDRIAERIVSMFDPVREQTSEAKTGNDRR